MFLLLRVYARTREEEREWKITAIILGGSAVAAPILKMIFKRDSDWVVMVDPFFSHVIDDSKTH